VHTAQRVSQSHTFIPVHAYIHTYRHVHVCIHFMVVNVCNNSCKHIFSIYLLFDWHISPADSDNMSMRVFVFYVAFQGFCLSVSMAVVAGIAFLNNSNGGIFVAAQWWQPKSVINKSPECFHPHISRLKDICMRRHISQWVNTCKQNRTQQTVKVCCIVHT